MTAGDEDRYVDSARRLLLAGLLLTPIVFNPRSGDIFMLPKLLVVWVTTAAASELWLLSGRRRSWHLRRSRVAAAAGVYLAVVIAATLASRSRLDSLLGSYQRYGGLLSLVLFLAAASLIVAVYTSRPTALVEITRVVTVAAGAVSAYVLLQTLGLDWVVWREPSGAIAKFHAGPMGNSDFAGGYLGLALPFAALGLWDQGRWRTCAYAVVVATVAALVVTRSRGGLLAALAGIVVFALARRGGISRRARAWIAGTTLVVATAAGVIAVTVRFPRVSALDRTELLRSKSTAVRAREWSVAWISFTHHPLLGTGPETYRYEFPRYRPLADGRDLGLQVADKPHNILLEHASDTGAPGALSYMAIIGASVAFALRRLPAAPKEERPLLAAFLGGLVAYLAQGLVSIDVPPLALMGWVALAGLAVLADPGLVAVRAASAADAARSTRGARAARGGRSPRRARRQRPTSPSPGPPFVVAGTVLAALAVAAWPAAADVAAGAAQRLGPRPTATRHWGQAVDRAPWQAAYRLDAGVFEEGQGSGSADPTSRARHLEVAERRYQDVLRLESENLFAVLGMARSETLWARTLDPARFFLADRWWSRAVRDDRRDWEVHDGRALMLNSWANSSGGDASLRRRAVDELRVTVAIKPTHVPALVNLGKLLRALGDEAGARAALDRAVHLDPSNQEARALLAAISGPS